MSLFLTILYTMYYLRGTRGLRYKGGYNRPPTTIKHVPYEKSWKSAKSKRLLKGTSTNLRGATNKGDMVVKQPMSVPESRLGRDASFASSIRQPGTLYFYRIGSQIGKGTNVGNRVGDTIRLLGYNFRIHGFNNNTLKSNHGKIRCIIVQDRFPTKLNAQDFFMSETENNTPVDFGTGPDSFRLLRPMNNNRFKVFYDKTFDMPLIDNEDQPQLFLNEYVKFNHKVTFNDDSPDVEGVLPSFKFYFFVESEANVAFPIAPLVKVLEIVHFAN